MTGELDQRALTLREIDDEFGPNGEHNNTDLRSAVVGALVAGNTVADVAVHARRDEATIRSWQADSFTARLLAAAQADAALRRTDT